MVVMRHCHLVVLVLLAGALGCIGVSAQRSESLKPAPALGSGNFGPTGEDVVQMEIALLEQPAGDRFLNYDLWEGADEQGVNLEFKPVLEANGFRVCQVGGLPPARLQALLTSPCSCPEPHRVQTHAGTPTPVLLGAARPRCAFRLEQDGGKEVVLEQAQCLLRVVPTLADEGRIVLRFTPEVQHSQATRVLQSEKDPAGELRWTWEEKRPSQVYEWLAWEVTVGPHEYVAVGTRLSRPDTLGHRCFLTEDGETPRQRLLVIRAARLVPEVPTEALRRAPPLALQARWSAARGCAP
jgi:hypothetical protein